MQEKKEKLRQAQQEYNEVKKSSGGGGNDHYPQQQQQQSWTPYGNDHYWSMYDGGSGNDKMWAAGETADRANPPLKGVYNKNVKHHKITKELESCTSMHERMTVLHAHMYVPEGLK